LDVKGNHGRIKRGKKTSPSPETPERIYSAVEETGRVFDKTPEVDKRKRGIDKHTQNKQSRNSTRV
jgi:hypothetical protein